jgi:hypothetical protein
MMRSKSSYAFVRFQKISLRSVAARTGLWTLGADNR